MSESAERIKAGEAHAGHLCGWCGLALAVEDDAALCNECSSTHHEPCWDRELGCSKPGCLNAPLTRLDAPAPRRAAAVHDHAGASPKKTSKRAPTPTWSSLGTQADRRAFKRCVRCGSTMSAEDEVCNECRMINTPDGVYHGPKTDAPGAVKALVLSLVGILFCGFIFGIWAIVEAQKVKARIREDPRLGGEGYATAATVIGIVDLVLVFVWMSLKLGK